MVAYAGTGGRTERNDSARGPGAVPENMVDHPAHYTRGPVLRIKHAVLTRTGTAVHRVECIEIIRHVRDMRLANALKYIWRVAFGGKHDDREDIAKAVWYLNDWLDNPLVQDDGPAG